MASENYRKLASKMLELEKQLETHKDGCLNRIAEEKASGRDDERWYWQGRYEATLEVLSYVRGKTLFLSQPK